MPELNLCCVSRKILRVRTTLMRALRHKKKKPSQKTSVFYTVEKFHYLIPIQLVESNHYVAFPAARLQVARANTAHFLQHNTACSMVSIRISTSTCLTWRYAAVCLFELPGRFCLKPGLAGYSNSFFHVAISSSLFV